MPDTVSRPVDNWDAAAAVSCFYNVFHDMCTLLLEYYGKHISKPRGDLFEKATGLRVTPADQSSASLLVRRQTLLWRRPGDRIFSLSRSGLQLGGGGGAKGGSRCRAR